VILKKLAVNKNYLKRLIKVLRKEVINFDKQVKEITKALTMLRY
jgi:hypothetical protein